MVLLRGFLHIDLIEAENLPDCDSALLSMGRKNKSDPYAQIKLGASVICKTAYIKNDLSPKWKESFEMPVCHFADELKIQVLDKDSFSGDLLGEVLFRVQNLLDGEIIEGWYPLSLSNGRIKVKLNFVSKGNFEVPGCYFPLRKGCKLTPYQDAHCPLLSLYQSIPTASGGMYNPPCAWIDLYKALNNAKKFIYITGWSVWTKTVLVRGDDCGIEGKGEIVGELLKRKAEEGVCVLMMIWNEMTSTDTFPGLMGTFDEETRQYFEGSNVQLVPLSRIQLSKDGSSSFQDLFVETCYSHHQKCVILDAPPAEGEDLLRLQAFIGGLDITKGRYDTPEHELFSTLHTLHQQDFYNNVSITTCDEGPREPWHDIHCRLDGPIVLDVIANFVERWRLQVKDKESLLFQITDNEFALEAPAACEEGGSWNAQLFRSITSDSALFDVGRLSSIPKRKGRFVDDSIHRAYIHKIRHAENYLYIENQYFLGSAYGWHEEQLTKAHHLIPQEITQRIVEKINDGHYFAAYVIIPMFPEGDPTSAQVQQMLHWQYRTMEMMYGEIAKAIQENKLDTHPRDYLSFFCLAKREVPDIPDDLSKHGKSACASRQPARLMIYVHSKLMIVDDEYIIIGSANINQRSMGGTRDSEIAVGSFQPLHTREVSRKPRGCIHEFRMALWAEHLSAVKDVHLNPGTLACMQTVNEMAESNWNAYIAKNPCKIDGHLMRYPVEVRHDGSVVTLEGSEYFPDTKASPLGINNLLPNKLTT